MQSPASVWGKTLTATGGTLLFLLSLLLWGARSGALSLQEAEIALTANLLSLLPVIVTLMPRIKNITRGTIILVALALELSAGYIILNEMAPVMSLSAANIPIIGILLLFSPVGLILIGAVLILLSH